MLDCDLLPPLALQLRDVERHGVVQTQLAALDENHHARRRRDDLRQAREVEDRVRRHRLALRNYRARAVSLAPHHSAAPRDEHNCARRLLLLDALVDRGVNEREPLRRHRNLRGLHGGQRCC